MRQGWRKRGSSLVFSTLCTLFLLPAGTQQKPTRLTGQAQGTALPPLVTGKRITPLGKQISVGSFPCNMIPTPDNKYLIVTNTGYRQYLTVIRVADGAITAQYGVNANVPKKGLYDKEGLYYGLDVRAKTEGGYTVYASRGGEDRVQVSTLNADGTLDPTPRYIDNPSPAQNDGDTPHHIAGIALGRDERILYAANNHTDLQTDLKGTLSVLDTQANRILRRITLPGFPFAVAVIPGEAQRPEKVYVSSERDGNISVLNPDTGKVERTLKTGTHPIGLNFNRERTRLYVANAGSDTVSVIDTRRDRVIATILLRPDDLRGLPGATPTGLSLAPDEKWLYVTLADMNCVAIVDLTTNRLAAYLPVGWYPTSVVAAPDGKRLFVANAKGVQERNPNSKPVGEQGELGQYIQNIIEGTVSEITIPRPPEWTALTRTVVVNNRITPTLDRDARTALGQPGIEHVIYIIKENRTYDQVLGDLPQGNGDPSRCLFPREVTPNQHALAERFVLLDNFYCCAEVSADGWQWSVSGMASEYTSRNAPYNYSGRGRNYDYEGQNNGVPAELFGVPDVARAPSGYIWDLCAKRGVSYRNYGFYTSFASPEVRTKMGGKYFGEENTPNKKALLGKTNLNFRQYDLAYADSEAWVKHNCPAPNQTLRYGKYNAPSRMTEWIREFRELEQKGNLPRFMTVRLGRDHTSGTRANAPSPRAMVADNDYAVGQLVETVSRSKYWSKTAIFILEDDAQNGPDHVDAHRSIAFVISPHVRRSTVDSTFYNTDSMLRTMGLLLGLPPLCQYDAVASPIAVFSSELVNAEPYQAILPERRIVAEVNSRTAYRARDSRRLISQTEADTTPDDELNDILWHSIKGRNTPQPAPRYGLRLLPRPKDDD